MMTRRITLTIAAAILGLILIGVLVFAATGGADGGGEATTSDTKVASEEQPGIDEIGAVSDHAISLSES